MKAKRIELERLETKKTSTLESIKLEQTEKQKHTEKFAKLKKEALEILKLHEDRAQQSNSNNTVEGEESREQQSNSNNTVEGEQSREINTMATNALNTTELASISKLLPSFNGAKDELEPFVANLEIIRDTISTEKQISFFNFVFRTKLTTRVQNKVRQISVPTNVETLLSSIKRAYGIKKSPNVILNELTSVVQSDSIQKLADRIETLTMELNELQVEALGEASRETISNTNAMIAFNAFKNGLKNREIVRTIEASRKKTLHEAIEIALEASSDIRQSQIMFQSAQTGNSSRNNKNGNNYNNNNKCTRCGGKHGNRCYAEGKNCNNCGGRNHFASMCLKDSNNRNGGNNNNNNNSRNYDNRSSNWGRSNYRGRGNYNNNINRNNGSGNRNNNGNYNNNRNRNVHHIQEQGNSQHSEILEYQESSGQNQ